MNMLMKIKIEMIVLGLVLMLMVTGCQDVKNGVQTPIDTIVESPVVELPETKETQKTFGGIDGDFTLEATNLWLEDVSLHLDSSLSLVNQTYNSYYILLKDEKESLPKTIDLGYYAELAGEATLRDLKDGVVTAMEDVEFNGIKGKRFYLKGMIEDPTSKKGEKSAEEELAEAIRLLAEAKTKAEASGNAGA